MTTTTFRLSSLYPDLAERLAALARNARPTDILSLVLPLAPELGWPKGWSQEPTAMAWSRPSEQEGWLALGAACSVDSAGPGRFAALQAAFAGLTPGWRLDDREQWNERSLGPLASIGFAFHEESPSGRHEPLPNARLRVPALLLRRRGDERTLVLSCPADKPDTHPWEALWAQAWQTPDETAPAPVWRRPEAPLVDQAFLARTRAALAEIAQGRLDKVVLTRRVQLKADRPLAAASLFGALEARQPGCTVFAVGHSGGTFIGATPERLLSLHQGHLETEALAGTSWHAPAERAEGPASTALEGQKNQAEHACVAQAIRQALASVSPDLAAAPARILELPGSSGLRHLRTAFSGQVLPGVTLFDLAARLHPTPAVGGWPTAPARQWLRQHGEDRPAWYSGGLGWINLQGDGNLAVALRCARLAGQEAELYAGAGIVAGSNPEEELAETEAKLGPMLDALHAPSVAAFVPDRRHGTG